MIRMITFYILSMFAVVTRGEIIEMPERRHSHHVIHARIAR